MSDVRIKLIDPLGDHYIPDLDIDVEVGEEIDVPEEIARGSFAKDADGKFIKVDGEKVRATTGLLDATGVWEEVSSAKSGTKQKDEA